MKFSPDLIMANLRKRKEKASDTSGVGSKRSRREELSPSVPPAAGLPEAILVEDDGGEKDPPAGVPIEGLSRRSPPAALSPPAEDVGGSSKNRKVTLAESSASTESIGGTLPAPQPPRGTDTGVPSGVPKGPVRASQTLCRELAYKSRLSETVLQLSVLPKFQATMKALPLGESFDTMFSAALQLSNGLFVLRDDLVSTKSELINAKSSMEGLKKELLEAKARESKVLTDLQMVEDLKKELLEAKTRELKALSDLRVVQEDSCAWREKAEKELQTLDTKLSEVTARLLPTEERLKETVLRLEHTEGRADNAEAAARDAAEKLVLAEKETKEALDKMTAAETRAQQAVQEYKDSPDFAAEFNEAVMDAFVEGFNRCKRRLSHHFQLKGLERFQPDEADPNIEVVGATADPAATKAPANDPIAAERPAIGPVEEGKGPGS